MLGEGLLLDALAHIQHLGEGKLPGLVMLNKRIVLQGVLGAFDVNGLEGMGGQFVIDNILGGDAKITGSGDAKVLIQMSCVA